MVVLPGAGVPAALGVTIEQGTRSALAKRQKAEQTMPLLLKIPNDAPEHEL